ncbi:HPr family phosphocarrier protein [Collinsella intestinalis]|uniref:HPr family phosphocarrier protein n=1 Tax=Collinsella intestinalis TaxID=147207 RepID=UPI0019584305|nr:HPr family phosphocarrier protein [Collinsella intestinalis]MBM6942170.1 HPr family phosphocarrier protein [Collinsella intestinalis]
MGSTGRFEYTVTDDAGLHARPAALLARRAGELTSDVTVSFGDRSANAKSMISIMSMGVHTGDTVTFELAGDAAAAEAEEFAAWCAENI